MPRNACTECRSRKIRCSTAASGQQCIPCAARGSVCSNAPPRQNLPFYASNERNPSLPSANQVALPSACNLRESGPDFQKDQPQKFVLSNSITGLDIGVGTPSELLRETEFTQALLLLYFSNFDDIHVMFDQTSYMQQFLLGNAHKAQLFAIMALGIRYSHASFDQPRLRPHWGEPLFYESRRLLQEEFDCPSIFLAQTYVLLATYHLTFGGTRKAWLYMGFARNIVSLLKLGLRHNGDTILEDDTTRRLVATIGLMENLFTPSINIERGFSPLTLMTNLNVESNSTTCRKSVFGPAELSPVLAIMNKIIYLAEIHYQIQRDWQTWIAFSPQHDFAVPLQQWQDTLPKYLWRTPENFEYHHKKLSIRPYAFMHLLQIHLQNLLLFKQLEWPPTIGSGSTRNTSTLRIYEQASSITSIVSWLWHTKRLEIHNASFAQIATITEVIHLHRLLSTTDIDAIHSTQSEIKALYECLVRIKGHCRLFLWVVSQLDWFMHICVQPDFWADERSWKSVIYGQLTTLGTSFERLNNETGGHLGTIESLAKPQTYTQQSTHQTPEILLPTFIPRPLSSVQ